MNALESKKKLDEIALLEELEVILCEIRNGRYLLKNSYKYKDENTTLA